MDSKTWSLFENQFSKWPNTKGAPVGVSEFELRMQAWKAHVDVDYRDFVLRYGGAIVGSQPIYGLRKAKSMGTVDGKDTAPEITAYFRNCQWVGVQDWFIFSIDLGGNPIGFSSNGTVWLSDQTNFRQIVQLAGGFEDYVLKWCLGAREVEDY